MTEIAEAPAQQGAGVARISHWIGGATVPGESPTR